MSASDLLEELPSPSDRRLAIRVTPDALRRIRSRHPWVYDRSVESVNHDDGSPGDLGIVFDRNRKFAAIGLWDPNSPIRLRMIHVGDPVTIDAAWFAQRIADSVGRRQVLFDRHVGSGRAVHGPAYRAVNGENDGLPALVVDVYDHVAVVKLYSEIWYPHLPSVVDGVVAATGADTVVLRLARNLQDLESYGLDDGDVIVGEVPDGPVLFSEGDLTFEADVQRGQKTGHFLDQRLNRLAVGKLAGGKRVLDVFASTGGFTVHAAAGGATAVHAVDASEPTLAIAQRNLDHNADVPAVAACTVTTQVDDAFDAMGALGRSGRKFDLVIVDPPSFAQKAATVGRARAAYSKLTKLAIGLIEDGGILVQASCSSRVTPTEFFDTVTETALEHGATFTEIRRTGHDIDHPVTYDEGEYLKAGYWRVETGSRRRRDG
ncbi:class I SAM-dependent rRNA methyltransferase [Ilumatobacter nonamiensis]|uniref:class I SAM-dependent rRNA methyltransferase n=1 Tax=Ilumatobacter nonamiensis TaxID=467093 RepID=UPI000347FC0F|nr:class I SAM-dependent rRNA methyltransferase [Ilumatobacter nonamiensis]